MQFNYKQTQISFNGLKYRLLASAWSRVTLLHENNNHIKTDKRAFLFEESFSKISDTDLAKTPQVTLVFRYTLKQMTSVQTAFLWVMTGLNALPVFSWKSAWRGLKWWTRTFCVKRRCLEQSTQIYSWLVRLGVDKSCSVIGGWFWGRGLDESCIMIGYLIRDFPEIGDYRPWVALMGGF